MSCSTMMTLVPSALIVGRRRIDVADDDRGEAEADLVAEEKARVGHEGAADRRTSAAGRRRACVRRQVAPLGEDREELVDAVERPRAAAGRRRRSGGSPRRVSEGNRRRPSGTSAMPWRTTSKARMPPIVAAVEADRCRAGCGRSPATVFRKVDLPAPLAPMIATVSPSSTASVMPKSAWKSP